MKFAKKMKQLIFILVCMASASAHAAIIGTDISTPGYSAADILNQNPFSADGIYWIDPDLPGGDDAFQVFADMTTFGGGWTMANDKSADLPTLVGHSSAINILAIDQTAQLRFVGLDFDAYFTGTFGNVLPGSSSWTVISGDASALFGAAWDSSFSSNDVFVRETATTSYPATVPLPTAVWLFGSGIIGLIGVARRKKA